MINRSKLDRLIAEKKARNRACHVIGFIIAIVYIFLYEIWWTRIPAYNDLIYKLGILSSTLSYSIVASYIFHYIITVIPEKKKRKEMSFALQYHHEILIDILSDLMVAVLQEDNWCLLSKLKTLDFTDFCPIFWYNDCKDFDKNKSFFLQFSYRF